MLALKLEQPGDISFDASRHLCHTPYSSLDVSNSQLFSASHVLHLLRAYIAKEAWLDIL